MARRHSEAGSLDVADILRYKEFSRRSALKAGLALGATTLAADILAACGGSKPTSSAPNYKAPTGKTVTSATPVAAPTPPPTGATIPTPRNQTVIIDQVAMTAYGSYNPLIPNGWDYQGGNQQVLAESLFYLNLATGALIKWQATGWDYNSDYTKLTLHLNPNVHWNDGQPFTSKDVKFTMELLQGNTGLTGSGLMTTQAKSVDAPDDHTVVFNLTERNTRYHYHFINAVVGADLLVLPAHVWSKQDPTTFKNAPPVFTGPYKLKEANRTLQYYLWQKDPNYWNKANHDPKPKYFAVRTGPAVDAAAAEFKAAKFDQGADYPTTKALIDSGYKNAMITSMVDPCLRAFLINCDQSKGILADPRFRTVISALIDRDKIANGVWTVKTKPAVYPWPGYANMSKWEDQSVSSKYQLTYDPGKAGQLLDAMGANKGSDGKRSFQGKPVSLTIITPSPVTGAEYLIGQLMQKELQKQGIDCNLQSMAGAVFNDAVNKGQYDIRSQWGMCSTEDPYQTYALVNSTNYVPVGTNALHGDDVRLKDSTMDNFVNELANASPDDPKSKSTFAQALDEWYKQMPMIPSIQTIYTHQANTTYWKGWPTDSNLYIQPNNWWGSFKFVLAKLKPTGAS